MKGKCSRVHEMLVITRSTALGIQSTHHVDGDFSDFRCAMGFAEVLDALLLLWNFISHDALQVGAVAGDVADACHDSRPVFLFGKIRDIFKCEILINRSRV